MTFPTRCSLALICCLLFSCNSPNSDSGESNAPNESDASNANSVPGETETSQPPVTTAGWNQSAILAVEDDIPADSVHLSGDRALVSGSGSADNFAGSAALYERGVNGVWAKAASLIPSDLASGDLFGESMSLNGDTAILVSAGDDDTGNLNGSAYFFKQDEAGEWVESFKALPDEGAGIGAVSMDGNRALLGGSDFGNAFSGEGYVYQRDNNGSWQRVATLRPGDTSGFDLLGLLSDGVSLSGNHALLSSPRDNENGKASGAVYVFEADESGEWRQQAKLMASDGASGDYFGVSVSVFGNTAFIGQSNPFDSSRVSSAYVFEKNDDGVWVEKDRLIASDSVSGDQFGRVVSLYGERALVSAPSEGLSLGLPGAVYEFERNISGNWVEANKITVGDTRDYFGWSVSLSGDRALVAEPRTNLAYIFDLQAP